MAQLLDLSVLADLDELSEEASPPARRRNALAALRSAIEDALEDLRNELPGLPDEETATEVGLFLDVLEEALAAALDRFSGRMADAEEDPE